MSREMIKVLAIVGTMSSDYSNDNHIVTMDAEVNDCLIKMYFVMMTDVSHPDHDRIYNDFLSAYHSLTEKQQEIVKKDFQKIINAQDKEQEKVKRKGEMKYE